MSETGNTDIDGLLAQLSLDEKAGLSAGKDMWTIAGIERFGIPEVTVTDGPNGARGAGVLGSGTATSVCIPCGSALGATFDPALVERVGAVLGSEARTKAARFLLAPTINLHRSPIAGRNFECYSEDPLLAGKIAAGFVRGVQSEGVAATPKHFVANDSEFERQTISSDVDERSLRELYLVPFELAVREGGALAVMTAYNRVNGVFCTENRWLLDTVLRNDWGFDGIVMTDWFGAVSTVESAVAGLDLEMPGPARGYGPALVKAVESGELDETVVDDHVHRWLHVIDRLGAWNDERREEQSIDRPEDRVLARQAATDSTVLLRNEGGLLPLDPSGSVALIGQNAQAVNMMGGGSAQLRPHYHVAPSDVLGQRLGDQMRIEVGCRIDKSARVLHKPQLQSGDGAMTVEYFATADWSGPPVATNHPNDTAIIAFGDPVPEVAGGPWSLRATGTFIAGESGAHRFSIVQIGRARLLVDGAIVVDGISAPPPNGDAFFGMGSEEMIGVVELENGQHVELVVEWQSEGSILLGGFKLGHEPPDDGRGIERAAAAATECDTAVVVVGTTHEWETEGVDRATMDLPGDQDELVRRVAAANPNTVVVVNTGSPITMPWADEVAAVLQVWLGGQEMAAAIDAVLFGEADPAGRLPTTIPLRLEHNPSFGTFPGENDHLRYGEGLLVGYRWYDTRRLPVRFPFGHGGSYTTFDWGEPSLSAADFAVGDRLRVELPVTNTGDRRGAEVVQCYLRPGPTRLFRPDRELKGFAKVWLDPGETANAVIELDDRSFAHWDPASTEGAEIREGSASLSMVPAGSSGHEARRGAGWYVDGGDWQIELGRSVADIRATIPVAVDGGRLQGSE